MITEQFDRRIAEAILYHHERYDGVGYPFGLAGEKIPLLSRIVLVADAFDAITSNRAYQPALSVDYAINEIIVNSGTQFDPQCGRGVPGPSPNAASSAGRSLPR